MSSSALLYLDQCYWGRLVRSEYEELADWIAVHVEGGRVKIPFSIVEFAETAIASPRIRRNLLPLFSRLTNHVGLINYLEHHRLEYLRFVHGRSIEWIRQRLLTYDWGRVAAPILTNSQVRDVLDFALERSPSRLLHPLFKWIKRYCAWNANRDVVSSTLDETMSPAEVAKLLKIPEHGIRRQKYSRSELFPTSTVMRELLEAIKKAKKKGIEENDILDVAYISQTLPYFDVVTVDRKMGARISEASIEKLTRAEVVSRIEQLRPTLEKVLNS